MDPTRRLDPEASGTSVLSTPPPRDPGARSLGLVRYAGGDYAETLRRWRILFEGRWQPVREMGFDQRFRRLWRYELSYCAGGFLERVIGAVEVVLAGPGYRGPSVRGSLS